MGFRSCPHCGKTISSRSRKCSGCGTARPFKTPKSETPIQLTQKPRPTPKPKPKPAPPPSASTAPPSPAPRSQVVDPSISPTVERKRGPTCTLCQGDMKKKTISSGNLSGLALGILVFLLGLLITVTIPFFGWVIGPIVMIVALFMGGKRRKVWQCLDCGHVADREDRSKWRGWSMAVILGAVIVTILAIDPETEPSGNTGSQEKASTAAQPKPASSPTPAPVNTGPSAQDRRNAIAADIGQPSGLSRHNLCTRVESKATRIMRDRQNGKRMSSAMGEVSGSEFLTAIVSDAYDKPRYSTERMQQRTIDDFASDMYRTCWGIAPE